MYKVSCGVEFVRIKVYQNPFDYPGCTRYDVLQPATSPFNPHVWPKQNFSLKFQYSIKQTSDENKEKYQLGFFLVDSITNSLN